MRTSPAGRVPTPCQLIRHECFTSCVSCYPPRSPCRVGTILRSYRNRRGHTCAQGFAPQPSDCRVKALGHRLTKSCPMPCWCGRKGTSGTLDTDTVRETGRAGRVASVQERIHTGPADRGYEGLESEGLGLCDSALRLQRCERTRTAVPSETVFTKTDGGWPGPLGHGLGTPESRAGRWRVERDKTTHS